MPKAEASAATETPVVKPEDRAPLPILQSAVQKGRILHLPILMYHHIGTAPAGSDATRKGLTVDPTDFEQQLIWLKNQGYQSTSLEDLRKFALGQNSTALPKKPIIFTFDDGYDDTFTNAIPLLKKYGYAGSFAIITNFPGTTLGNNTYATWDAIKTAQGQGMEIVCHTQNHFDGTSVKFGPDYIFQNLNGCQTDLLFHLGSVEPIIIYPYGHYSSTYIEQAKKAGFAMGITVHEGSFINLDDLFEIPRVRVSPGISMEKFQERLDQ